MSSCAAARREHSQAASSSWTMEIFHSTDIMLSLWMGAGQGQRGRLALWLFQEFWILSWPGVQTSFWAVNWSSGGEKNCIVYSSFCILVVIVIIITISISSSGSIISISVVALLSQPKSSPFCSFLLSIPLGGKARGERAAVWCLFASCRVKLWQRGVRISERNNSARRPGQWKRRWKRCSRHWSGGSPAAHGDDYGEAGCPPAAHGGPWWSRYPSAAHGQPHARAGRWAWRSLWPCGKPMLEQAPGRICRPMERRAHTGAGLLAGLVTPGGTHAGAVREELQYMGRTLIGEINGGLSPVGRTSC